MQPWTWLTAYVVGFGLLQALLYHRFQQRTPTGNAVDASSDQSSGGHGTTGEETTPIPCHHCGTVNDANQMVEYCRECTEPLR